MQHNALLMSGAAALAFALTACGGGGGGGGGGVNSTPTPPLTPTPPPPPPPPSAPFGVTSDTEFGTVGDNVEFRWDHEARAYEIRVPGYDWGRLRQKFANNPYAHDVFDSAGNKLPFSAGASRAPGFSYTDLGAWYPDGAGANTSGTFAYGIPTRAGDVPTTGTASYHAIVSGSALTPDNPGYASYGVGGTARLNFDFAGGTLTGYMQPELSGAMGAPELPRYDFSQTVFSVGSTSFSGSFVVPGSTADSSFSGVFTGSRAAELMASWRAPFLDTWGVNGAVWGTMSGVWIGKKGP